MHATVTLASGIELPVEFEVEPASGDGWHEPRVPASIEIVRVGDYEHDVATTPAEDRQIVAALWEVVRNES